MPSPEADLGGGELEVGKFENFENIKFLKKIKFETKLIYEKKISKKIKI